MKARRWIAGGILLLLAGLFALHLRPGGESDSPVVRATATPPVFATRVPVPTALPPTPTPGPVEPTVRPDPGTEALRPRPAISKPVLMHELLSAGYARNTQELWERYQALGITLSQEELETFIQTAKQTRTDLTRAAGGWDSLLRFWATRDPAAALRWAEKNGLASPAAMPDEIVFRMVETWGDRDRAAALAYALSMGYAQSERGVRVLNLLQSGLDREAEASDALLALPNLPPEEQRAAVNQITGRGRVSGEVAAAMLLFLDQNQGRIAPDAITLMLGPLVNSLQSLPGPLREASLQNVMALPMTENALSVTLNAVANYDLDRAFELIASLPPERQDRAVRQVMSRWASEEPAAAFEYLQAQATADAGLVRGFATGLATALTPPFTAEPPEGVEAMVQAIQTGLEQGSWGAGRRDTALDFALLDVLARYNPSAAMERLTTLGPEQQAARQSNLLAIWAQTDLAGAMAWVNAQTDPAVQSDALKSILPHFSRLDPAGALNWLQQLRDPQQWETYAETFFRNAPQHQVRTVLGDMIPDAVSSGRGAFLAAEAIQIGFTDANAARSLVTRLVEQWPEGGLPPDVQQKLDEGFLAVTGQLALQSEESGLAFAESFRDLPLSESTWREVGVRFRQWSERDPSARQWLEQSRFGEQQKAWIRGETAPP